MLTLSIWVAEASYARLSYSTQQSYECLLGSGSLKQWDRSRAVNPTIQGFRLGQELSAQYQSQLWRCTCLVCGHRPICSCSSTQACWQGLLSPEVYTVSSTVHHEAHDRSAQGGASLVRATSRHHDLAEARGWPASNLDVPLYEALPRSHLSATERKPAL